MVKLEILERWVSRGLVEGEKAVRWGVRGEIFVVVKCCGCCPAENGRGCLRGEFGSGKCVWGPWKLKSRCFVLYGVEEHGDLVVVEKRDERCSRKKESSR